MISVHPMHVVFTIFHRTLVTAVYSLKIHLLSTCSTRVQSTLMKVVSTFIEVDCTHYCAITYDLHYSLLKKPNKYCIT